MQSPDASRVRFVAFYWSSVNNVLSKRSWETIPAMSQYMWVLDEYLKNQQKWEPYYWSQYGRGSDIISPHFFIIVGNQVHTVTAGTIGNGFPKMKEVVAKLVGQPNLAKQ